MKKYVRWIVGFGLLGALVLADILMTRPKGGDEVLGGAPAVHAQSMGRSMVAIATSEDVELADPASIDAYPLTYAQVDAVVRRALDLDTSDRSLRNSIGKDDWVLIKVNMVTAPIVDDDGDKKTGFWADNVEHWGDVTDARVVKSVINYLIEHVGPRKITIAEGSAGWSRKNSRHLGAGYGNSYDTDGWEVRWREFDNLSYVGMMEAFNAAQSVTVVDTCDLNDASYRFEPVPGGALQRVGASYRSSDRFGYMVPVPMTGTPREGFWMPEPVLDADKMITIPVMKTNIGGATLAMKNYVGTLASRAYGDATSKGQMDSNQYERGFLDLFAFNPAVYAVIPGFWAEEGSWPGRRYNLHHNVVVAGGDVVATESTAMRVMGINPLDAESILLAGEKGFGVYADEMIDVVGASVEGVRLYFQRHSGFKGLGFQRWLVNGPHESVDLSEDLLGGEGALIPKEGELSGGEPWRAWEHLPTFPEAYVDLRQGVEGDLSNTVTYGSVVVESDRNQDGYLWFGGDDGAKVWLNGEVVLEQHGPLEMRLGQFLVPVSLQAGSNPLLVKVRNRFGDTGFAASIVDENGGMLFDMRAVLPPPGIVKGDVSDNGKVTAYDAALVLFCVVGLADSTEYPNLIVEIADVTDDGTISPYDASFILQYAVGAITDLSSVGATRAKGYASLRTVRIGPPQILPDGSALVSIWIDDMEGVRSGEIEMGFDRAVWEVAEVLVRDTTPESCSAANVVGDHIRVAFAVPRAVSGLHCLAEIRLRPMTASEYGVLHIRSVRLNEGAPEVRVEETASRIAMSTVQSFPNPFNSATMLVYRLPQRARVSIVLYNAAGQRIRGLLYTEQSAGTHRVSWDGLDSDDRPMPSGVYICRVVAGTRTEVVRLLLIR